MEATRSYRAKATEWLRRYLPLEIAGWIGELGAAAVVYLWTDSLAAAAVAATIGSSVGYYAPAYVNAVRWSAPGQEHLSRLVRAGMSHLLALRSLALEFGPAEAIDSLIVRPALIYAGPVYLNHVLLGWVVGGFVALIVFYVCTILSYEKFRRFLAIRPGARHVAGDAIGDIAAEAVPATGTG